MEVSALKPTALPALRGPAPLLRLQSDERLIALIRRGNHAAFEALVSRYESRLLAFCRHMLASREDAEDVLQEVFTAAFNAILADEREINVRPWLYRIARNRSLNHLRRAVPIGVDSMDVHYADQGESTSDRVFKREAFRQLIEDVQQLPETQRTALLLREIDALSYEQIGEAMETTIPSVKSLLVRARISLAEAAEARKLSCEEVRFELGEVAEGLTKLSAPARRHVRDCDRCHAFRAQLKSNNQVLAAVFPVGIVLLVKRMALAKLGSATSAGGAHVGAGTAAGAAGAAGATAGGGAGTGLITAGAELGHKGRCRSRRGGARHCRRGRGQPVDRPSPHPSLPRHRARLAPRRRGRRGRRAPPRAHRRARPRPDRAVRSPARRRRADLAQGACQADAGTGRRAGQDRRGGRHDQAHRQAGRRCREAGGRGPRRAPRAGHPGGERHHRAPVVLLVVVELAAGLLRHEQHVGQLHVVVELLELDHDTGLLLSGPGPAALAAAPVPEPAAPRAVPRRAASGQCRCSGQRRPDRPRRAVGRRRARRRTLNAGGPAAVYPKVKERTGRCSTPALPTGEASVMAGLAGVSICNTTPWRAPAAGGTSNTSRPSSSRPSTRVA